MNVLDALLAASLCVSPGAWIAFTVCDRRTTAPRVRWALAAMLSPACFAAQVVAIAACGLPFATAARIAAVVDLAALALPCVRANRGARAGETGGADLPRGGSPWLLLAAWIALVAPIAWFWIRAPDYRVYGWHNQMNTAIAYRVAELPAVPEDPDLAGVRLNYGWLGHVQTTAMAELADVAPTLVFPFVDAGMLLVLLVLMEASMAALRPRTAWSATSTSALVLAGTMITGLVLRELVPSDHPNVLLHELSGDLRVAPILAKFHNFDAMVIGIAGLAALVYFAVAEVSANDAGARTRSRAMLVIVAAAIGLSYPVLFPFACVVVGVVLATSLRPRAPWAFIAACAAACAIVVGYVRWLGRDAETTFVTSFHGATVAYALITMAHALWIWVWIAWPSLRQGWRQRGGAEFRLGVALVVLIAIALVLQMKGDTHYKVYFAQVAVLAPLMLARIDAWAARRPVATATVAGMSVLALSVTTAAWVHGAAPANARARSTRQDESSFATKPPASAAHEWIDAVRERAPRDAIVVAPPVDLPLAVLTGRAQYLSKHPAGRPVLGYSLEMGFLFENKGYPAELVARRARWLEACYRASDGAAASDFVELTEELRSHGRTVVIAFPPAGSAYERWLRSRGAGSELFRNAAAIVWSLEP